MSPVYSAGGPGRLAAVLAAGALLASCTLLTSCAGPADLDSGAASRLQSRVLSVSKDAAGKDYSRALADLDQLGRDLDAAAAAGEVTPARREQISSAMVLVRADLTAARTAASPTPLPSAAPPATTAAATPAPSTAPAPSAAPAPAPAQPKGPAKAPAKDQGHPKKAKGKKDH